MEYLAANIDWLQQKLEALTATTQEQGSSTCYFIFDCPGQVELFTGQAAFKKV